MSRKLLIAAALVAVAVAAIVADAAKPKWHQLDGYTFERYIADWNKKYEPVEHAKRKALFDAELKLVQSHNAAGTFSWRRGVNEFSDWTEFEKRTRLRGMDMSMKMKYGRKPRKHIAIDERPLPAAVDWRAVYPPVLTSVKNQGQCGSCWSHAAVETIESAWAISTGQLYVLSQQQILDCTPNPNQCGGTGGCGGGIAELAIDFITQAGGIVEEWAYPYRSFFGTNYKCNYWQNLTVVKTTGYAATTPNSKDAVLSALAFTGPLAISVDASDWSNYEAGVFSGCYYSKNISMDHAVMAVGFKIDEDSGNQVLIVRNSWSPGWGENGYINLLISGRGADCGLNVNPQNGNGCKGQTAPQYACGMCGAFFDTLAAIPGGITP